MLRVRIDEGSEKQPQLLWDTVWQPSQGQGDWALAGAEEHQNRGGLRARAALHTAVILSLFTDKRMPVDHPLARYVEDTDPRGWWGDGIDVQADLSETEMGSLLWAFERSTLTEDDQRWVKVVAEEALAPLIQQGAVVRVDVQVDASPAFNRLNLYIQLYGRDGSRVYEQRFEDIWKQSMSAQPQSFTDYPAPPSFAGNLDFSKFSQSGLLPLI